MKKIAMMILSTSVVLAVSAKVHKFNSEFQAVYDAATTPEVQEAQRKGANAKIIYRVVDDEGSPITNATVYGQWQNDYPRKTWKETFVTDGNGEFIAKEKVGGRFGFYVKKEGYYLSSTGVDFHWREGVSPLVKDGKWQPYGEKRTLIVKRKKNPVVMESLHYTSIAVPATNVWLGIDMESFQWTQPYGNGKYDDMLLRFNYEMHDKYAVQWATMDISFTNNQYAGFYVLPKHAYSEFKSPYHANANAVFSQTRTFRHEFFNKYVNAIGEGDCMIFRTRTRVDEDGNLISAHYGKIYGLWEFSTMIRVKDMFFNPNPNDTNLEDMHTFKESESRNW
jgi:hypothetical protein